MSDERAYPQHSTAQDKEERSKRLLEQLAPASWQIRPIGERDVGIDGEAEIRVNNRYTGWFFKYQVIVRRRPSLTACGFHFRRRGYGEAN